MQGQNRGCFSRCYDYEFRDVNRGRSKRIRSIETPSPVAVNESVSGTSPTTTGAEVNRVRGITVSQTRKDPIPGEFHATAYSQSRARTPFALHTCDSHPAQLCLSRLAIYKLSLTPRHFSAGKGWKKNCARYLARARNFISSGHSYILRRL